MKKNNKGFLLAEVFIVSGFVLGVLVYMFIQINSIIKNYNRSFSYDTVEGLYMTNEVINYIKIKEKNTNTITTACSSYQIISFEDDLGEEIKRTTNIKTAILGNSSYLKTVTNDSNITPKAQDYINYMNQKNNCILLLEFNDDTYASLNM